MVRFLLGSAVSRRLDSVFPFGTLAVNLSGTFLLGLLVGLAVPSHTQKLLGTGLLGAYTTFSTWSLESQRLREGGRPALGVVNFAASLILGLLLAWAGRGLGTSL